MPRGALVALLLTAALAGCIADDPAPQTAGSGGRTGGGSAAFAQSGEPEARQPESTTWGLEGVVVDRDFAPLADATVRLRTGANTTTDAQGAFRFEDVLPTIHVLNVTHAMGSASLSVDATEPPRPVVVVVTSMTVEPYTATEQYRGHLQCASEALIISGSCDTLLGFTNDQLEPSAGRPLPEPLSRNDNFTLVTENGWETLVIDVVWDAAAYPGLDGLRVIVQGPGGRDDLGAYDKYVTAHDADGRMTIRLAPGERYESGVIQIPDQGTALDIRVLPHSYGYHEICDPDGQCFLGLGAGTDLEFQVLATTFYHEPAPPGWAHA